MKVGLNSPQGEILTWGRIISVNILSLNQDEFSKILSQGRSKINEWNGMKKLNFCCNGILAVGSKI